MSDHVASGGSSRTHHASRRGGLPSVARAILNRLGYDRDHANTADPLSDHLLRDIGISRADLQALFL